MRRATASGLRTQLVSVMNPSTPVPDGDGGFRQDWSVADPGTVYAYIQTAGPGIQERPVDGTVTAEATHTFSIPYHAQITTLTRLICEGEQYSVTGVQDPDHRHIDLVLLAVHLEGAPPLKPAGDWVAEGWY
jgi:head-tail adaptor